MSYHTHKMSPNTHKVHIRDKRDKQSSQAQIIDKRASLWLSHANPRRQPNTSFSPFGIETPKGEKWQLHVPRSPPHPPKSSDPLLHRRTNGEKKSTSTWEWWRLLTHLTPEAESALTTVSGADGPSWHWHAPHTCGPANEAWVKRTS